MDAETLQGSEHAHSADLESLFEDEVYLIRRKVLKLLGAAFQIFDSQGIPLFYVNQKAFKLKEDIRVYIGESIAPNQEALLIAARQVIDFSAGYDVIDPIVNEKVGGLRRRGFRSMIRDEWLLLDAEDREIGLIREDSAFKAVVRRLSDDVSFLFPQKYHIEMGGDTIATYQQHFNPFIQKITCDFRSDHERRLDRRLGVAAMILLCAVEGRQ